MIKWCVAKRSIGLSYFLNNSPTERVMILIFFDIDNISVKKSGLPNWSFVYILNTIHLPVFNLSLM